MINVSDEIKQAYDISTTQLDKIKLDNIEYSIMNVQYYDDCYENGNAFGTAIARVLEFEIENNVDLEGKEFEYLTGIEVNGIVQWITLGNFIVQDVEPNNTTNINKITAIDYMLKTNIPYVTNLNYSTNKVTLLMVLQELCEKSNLILATTDFANKDFIVDSNQFVEGTLNRQVLQAIAQISGTVAKIKNDNKLYLINPNNVTEVSKVFTLNNYEEAEIKRATHPINLVSLSMTDIEGENITLRDEESILQNGENSLVINDNPFAYTQEKREQLITALFNAVKGFEYKAFLFECQGLPYLETMDKIQFKDKQDNTYNSYVFRFNYKSPNGLESEIEAPSITKATVNYQNIPNALDKLKHTELKVNKLEGKITLLASEHNETAGKVSEITQTVDSITQKVENVATYANVKIASGEVHLTETQEDTENIIELKFFGETTTGRLELVADKQSKANGTSANAFTHLFELDGRLLEKNGTYDEIIIQDFNAKLIRRLGLNENVISNSTFKIGNLNYAGVETSSESMVRSDYTQVFANKEYKVTKKESVLEFIYAFFYNGNKEFISSSFIRNYTDPYSTVFTTPNECAYVRIVLNGSSYGAAIDFDVTEEEVVLKLNTDDVYVLDEEIVENLGTIKIKTFENDTYLYVKNQELNYYCRYLTDNEFTRTYAKKAEVKLTTDNISHEVSKKVGNDEIISKINQSAEAVRVLARLIDINGVISANGNFKVNADGTMECTNAKIKAADTGIDAKNCGVVAESTNYIGEYYSDGLTIYNKNIDNADFVIIRPNGITTYDANRYGFDFWVGSDGKINWVIKDASGKLLQASDTQFNLWSPGQNTHLMLGYNGAYINGYPIQTATSDRRLKTNIQDSTENALEKIMQIKHRSFVWKENGQEQKNGYIAQELEKIDKEFVINENDKYSVNVLNLLATTTKAMQELNLKVEELQQEIDILKGEA